MVVAASGLSGETPSGMRGRGCQSKGATWRSGCWGLHLACVNRPAFLRKRPTSGRDGRDISQLYVQAMPVTQAVLGAMAVMAAPADEAQP